jgi:Arc/MetJ-type ribon-helix-helix transcriptional regulator
MMRRMTKISVTVPSAIVDLIDSGVTDRRYSSRSAAVTGALESWARQQRNAAIDAYYDAREAEDRAEEREWATLGHEALARSAAREGLPRPRVQRRPSRRASGRR